MEHIRKLWPSKQSYEAINDEPDVGDGREERTEQTTAFSYVEYGIFLLLGISMLWAWNMFLAAVPYFQHRFRSNRWIFDNFQAAELSVSTLTNLGAMLLLTRLQAHASYPKRIISSLAINIVIFALLAISTKLEISAEAFFAFLMVMMLSTSFATALCQNGIFAYVSGYGQPVYTQAIMTGQAVAGVLPCIAQIISVLSVSENRHVGPPPEGRPPGPPPVSSTAALAYFLTATILAIVTWFAFLFLLARHRKPQVTQDNSTTDSPDSEGDKKSVSFTVLLRKLFWLATGVFITFAITMFFPVFTQNIVSVTPSDEQTPLLRPPVFIPLAFLFWNIGDLLGRLITAVPSLSLVKRPRIIFGLAVSRIAFVGLYHLCNIRGRGAVIQSDFFYLFVVQLLFGLTNGYIGSICMIGAGSLVLPDEREAAGSFMGLCLVGGLAVGSLTSFFAVGA